MGKGTFARVFLVKRKSDGVKVAIKKIRDPYSELSETEKQGVHSEVKAIRQMQHPFVIKFIEWFLEDDSIYIVTEYADGGMLDVEKIHNNDLAEP